MEKKEAYCPVGGNVNKYSRYGEEYGDSLKKKTRNTSTIRSRVSLVAQLVRNPPVMRDTWVRFLGWEGPLEKGWVTHSSILVTSLVAQLVRNPPVMWDTWVRFLGWEDPLEMGMVTHSSVLAWRIPRTV